MNHTIDFASMDWNEVTVGCRDKFVICNGQKLRLVEFAWPFVEEHWCEKGHLGYVLEGMATLHLQDSTVVCKQGDGVFIPAHTPHKVIIEKGERIVFVFVEQA